MSNVATADLIKIGLHTGMQTLPLTRLMTELSKQR